MSEINGQHPVCETCGGPCRPGRRFCCRLCSLGLLVAKPQPPEPPVAPRRHQVPAPPPPQRVPDRLVRIIAREGHGVFYAGVVWLKEAERLRERFEQTRPDVVVEIREYVESV